MENEDHGPYLTLEGEPLLLYTAMRLYRVVVGLRDQSQGDARTFATLEVDRAWYALHQYSSRSVLKVD